jgi:hypothetical protein
LSSCSFRAELSAACSATPASRSSFPAISHVYRTERLHGNGGPR